MINKIFNNKKNTLLFLICVFSFLTLVFLILSVALNFNFCILGDNQVQYRNFLIQKIVNIKNEGFSYFNYDNLYGTSLFADIYYIPFNLEFLFVWLGSYIINPYTLYAVCEFSKFGIGAVLFYIYVAKYEKKDSLISFCASLFYIFSGFSLYYVCYPTFHNIIIYFPLFLIIYKCNIKPKYLLTVPFSLYLICADFYVAYILYVCLFLFIAFDIYYQNDWRGAKNYFKKIIKLYLEYGLSIILGVLLGCFILLPSVYYIVLFSASKKYDICWVVFPLQKYIYLIITLFKLPLVGLINATKNYLFFEGGLFIGIVPSIILLSIFSKSNKGKFKKEKIILLCESITLFFPIFSKLFCGNILSYARWYFVVLFINIIMSMNIFEKYNLDNFNTTKLFSKFFVFASCFAISTLLLYIVFISVGYFKSFDYMLTIFIALISSVLALYVIIRRGNFFYLKKACLLELSSAFLIFIFFCVIQSYKSTKIYRLIDEYNIFLKSESIGKDKIHTNNGFTNLNSYETNYLTNEGLYFHSFYNKNYNKYHLKTSNSCIENWTIGQLNDGNLFSGAFFNYKYHLIENKNDIYKNSSYYKLIKKDEKFSLYEIKEEYQNFDFMVYDYTVSNKNLKALFTQALMLKGMLDNDGLPLKEITDIPFKEGCNNFDYIETKDGFEKYKFNTDTSFEGETVYSCFVDSYEFLFISFYIEFDDGSVSTIEQNDLISKDAKPLYLYVSTENNFKINLDSNTVHFLTQSMPASYFDECNQIQAQYEKNIEYKNDEIHIKAKSENHNAGYIVLPITYTPEWKIKGTGESVERCNYSFIGFYVDDLSNVDVTLCFKPNGLNAGIKTSILSTIAFVVLSSIKTIYYRKRELELF